MMRRRYVVLAGAGALSAVAAGLWRSAHALPMTREIADMTSPEVRDAVAAGFGTVIVPSGGLEQNGPHMIISKHDRIVAYAARRIAEELGDALVAPVLSYVPQGDYDPPTGNLAFPGTVGVPAPVFGALLEGIARSFKLAGFSAVCFIADHGGSLAPQAEVAARLSAEWGGKGPKVLAVESFYADAEEMAFLRAQGEPDAAIGEHATIADTSELMAVHPGGVDLSRLPSGPLSWSGHGVAGDPRRASAARGDALMAIKISAAVAQIRAATSRAAR